MATISGNVSYLGSPAVNARVNVFSPFTESVVGYDHTDINGNYSISGLDTRNDYHVFVEYKHNGITVSYHTKWSISSDEGM